MTLPPAQLKVIKDTAESLDLRHSLVQLPQHGFVLQVSKSPVWTDPTFISSAN